MIIWLALLQWVVLGRYWSSIALAHIGSSSCSTEILNFLTVATSMKSRYWDILLNNTWTVGFGCERIVQLTRSPNTTMEPCILLSSLLQSVTYSHNKCKGYLDDNDHVPRHSTLHGLFSSCWLKGRGLSRRRVDGDRFPDSFSMSLPQMVIYSGRKWNWVLQILGGVLERVI